MDSKNIQLFTVLTTTHIFFVHVFAILKNVMLLKR